MEEFIFNMNCGALKSFNDFTRERADKIQFQYIHDQPQYELLKEKYMIEQVAGNDDELSKAINLLNWVFENNYHNGRFNGPQPFNSLNLLNYSYKNGKEKGISCFGLAIILSECLLSIGIKSRILHLLSFNPYDIDSHVVTIAYINKLNKWIMLDPTCNCYFMDENKNILSPWEIREILGNQGYLVCNKEVGYNDLSISFEDLNNQRIQYMARNMFCMSTNLINTFNSQMVPCKFGYLKEQRNIYLAPNGFNPYERRIENTLYRIKVQGENTENLEYLNFLKETKGKHIIVDLNTFIQKP
ncbi:transglutaminase domain-containing protein [Clostridium lundense]|uniref:transglutaminase domain-containing protein n=1 Tax=Clostridium lundense TaxID=319475 RepID=UPI00047F4444|nr:transglutaminase domain-containing protein [Clostridium lundense]